MMENNLLDLETEYNNRQRVPEYTEIVERWDTLSTAYRLASAAQCDRPYGTRARQRFDFFAGESNGPVAIYVHGGYWQRGDRKDYSFLARELNALGISVAIPSYSLCPAASVTEIADEIAFCVVAIWKKTGKRPLVIGHSAGGHLAATMLANEWGNVAGVPPDLVRASVGLSGIYDLAPLIKTTLNKALQLTAGTARAASPIWRPPPPKGRHFIAAVGEAESGEFLRQSRDLAEAWGRAGVNAVNVVVPEANHFTILEHLLRSGSPLLTQIVTLARDVNTD
jgi:arylformamidase